MAGLMAAYDAKRKDGAIIAYPVAAGARVFKGALVAVNTATGLVQPASDAVGLAFVGVAYEGADNSAGAAGAESVRVMKTGLYRYSKAGAVQADVGKVASVVDDNTVATVPTAHNVVVGVVAAFVDGGTLGVLIEAGG